MEITIPITIVVLGHSLVKTVTVGWSATAGMVPQALRFSSEGGRAEALLTSQNPLAEMVRYHVHVTFAAAQLGSQWHIEISDVIPVNAGGDAVVIDLSQWVRHLILQFHRDDTPDMPPTAAPSDHLVVNLTWQGQHLSQAVKCSQRMTPNTIWEVPYICSPDDCQITATLSAFGVIDRHLVRLSAQSIDPNQSPYLLKANRHGIYLTTTDNCGNQSL